MDNEMIQAMTAPARAILLAEDADTEPDPAAVWRMARVLARVARCCCSTCILRIIEIEARPGYERPEIVHVPELID